MGQCHPIACLLASSLAIAAAAPASAAEKVFRDDFANGKASLGWEPHPLSGDTAVRGEKVDTAPDGDGGIGVLHHPGGSRPTVSYAETAKADDDFEIEAFVSCPFAAGGRDGTLTGLAFYILGAEGGEDPDVGGFYRLVCDYRMGNAAFSLAYLGANMGRQPLELERWTLLEETASADVGAPWREVRIIVDQGLMSFYVDGTKMNERPIPAERVITDIANVAAGHAGVYAGHIGQEGTATARVDGFVYRVR